MLNSNELEVMSNLDIRSADRRSLVDIQTVKVDGSLPQLDKIENILSQIRNPYCFISGDTPVRVRFAAEGKDLTQSLLDYFTSSK